jgi:O-methyltransferase involved in polyketide biosynthesis
VDLVVDERIGQYVLLGAGLDTFAQRHPDLAGQVRVFEIDQPGPQAWKRRRLVELVDEADRPGLDGAARGARAAGTPWISFYAPDEIVILAREAGFADARYVPTPELAERHLAGRTDGLTAAGGEGILLART